MDAIQDFLQVFQGSGIEKMEDNQTSVDPLSKQILLDTNNYHNLWLYYKSRNIFDIIQRFMTQIQIWDFLDFRTSWDRFGS